MRFTARVLLVLMLPACVSPDPTADLRSAAGPVAARAGIEPGWERPWNERSDAWDGRAPLASDTAVHVALRNNRELRAAVEAIVAARADFVQAHLLPNPIITVAVGLPIDGLGGEPLAVALMQQLAWLWQRPAAIDSAEATLRSQVLSVSDAALRLVADVRRAHARVVFAERALSLRQENLEVITRSAGLAESLLGVGELSRPDVNRLVLERERERAALTDAAAELALAQRDLLELLARADADATWRTDDVVPGVAAPDAPDAPDAPAAPAAPDAPDAPDEERVVALAMTQRLDVAAADAACAGGRARLALANSGRLPDVAAGVGYEKDFSSREGIFPRIAVTPKLFDDNSARVARAASELAQAEIEADRVRQAAIAETRRAWIALRAGKEVVVAYERGIVQRADEDYRLTRAALEAGESDMNVVLAAQRLRNDARLELLARRRAAADARFELERAVGGALAPPGPAGRSVASREVSP